MLESFEAGHEGINRREFLTYAWAGALGLLTLESGLATYQFMYPRFREGEFGGKFPLGAASVLPQTGIDPQSNTTGKFWLINTDEGPRALYMVCTHLGCLYKWEPSNSRFECPCHGSKFNREGHFIEGPAPRSLDQFQIEIVQGGSVVSMTEDARRQDRGPHPARTGGGDRREHRQAHSRQAGRCVTGQSHRVMLTARPLDKGSERAPESCRLEQPIRMTVRHGMREPGVRGMVGGSAAAEPIAPLSRPSLPEPAENGRDDVNRRELLAYAWIGTLGLLTLGSGLAAWQFIYPRSPANEFGGKFYLGSAANLPPVGGEPQNYPEGRFWLVNTEKGPHAIYILCTHSWEGVANQALVGLR